MSLLGHHHFREGAGLFHYPPTYTPEELLADQVSISSHLDLLLREIGELETITRSEVPTDVYFAVGFGGGNIPYWSSHPELNQTMRVVYQAKAKREGEVLFVILFVRPKGNWEIRNFTIEISASRPGAKERILDLTKKLQPSMQQSPKSAANPTLNPDLAHKAAPVRFALRWALRTSRQ